MGGFGSVSMYELAAAAGVAWRTLYNQFSSKEEIFREMPLAVPPQLKAAFPCGFETRGDVEDVLRQIANVILELIGSLNKWASCAWSWRILARSLGLPRSSLASWIRKPADSRATWPTCIR
jgi:AcrR family transcriptional regulator